MNHHLQQILDNNITTTPTKFIVLCIIAGCSFIIGFLLFQLIKIGLKRSYNATNDLVNKKFRTAFVVLFVVICMNFASHALDFKDKTEFLLTKGLYIAFIISLATLLVEVTGFIRELIYEKNRMNKLNAISRRKIKTQIDFIQKVGSGFIVFIAICLILMTFNRIREIGTSIIASAGVITLIAGLAAQRSLANLMAGLQLAFTQPVRIDDAVVVEGEFGEIEEITLTYVVVRIWDRRRLILPISYFIEKPFQSWTRVSTDLLTFVEIYTDYNVPLEVLRAEFQRILSETNLWDGKISNLQMTEIFPANVKLRGLMSAKDASTAWDLKCLVREKLVAFLQENYPHSLPKVRTEPAALTQKADRTVVK
ncbi:MAG TPA: mechanosensitive ion channel domain-containing protein [Cytophagaceae bacterium]|nr:mechanosensitive ion channel domain-containing protein [Cytophagaceae bacterium]